MPDREEVMLWRARLKRLEASGGLGPWWPEGLTEIDRARYERIFLKPKAITEAVKGDPERPTGPPPNRNTQSHRERNGL